jgi:hypothetical protein
LQVPGGQALSDSEKAIALAGNLEWGDARISACSRKWTEINQPLGGPTGHQGIQGWQGRTIYRIESWDIYLSTRWPFLRKCLTWSSAGSTSHQQGNTLAWYPYWSRETTPRYLLPIDP